MPREPAFRKAKPGQALTFDRSPRHEYVAYGRRGTGRRKRVLSKGDVAMRLSCCDCGLVHDFRVKIRPSHILIYAWRNGPSTGGMRTHSAYRLVKRAP